MPDPHAQGALRRILIAPTIGFVIGGGFESLNSFGLITVLYIITPNTYTIPVDVALRGTPASARFVPLVAVYFPVPATLAGHTTS